MINLDKKRGLGLLVVFASLAAIPLSLNYLKQKTTFFGKASGQQANIVVDYTVKQGLITPMWQNVAQGGEEKYPFADILTETQQLNLKYIRIDHIYDFYNLVSRVNGELVFDWTGLDQTVADIIRSGARPFLSLSYMPPVLAKNGIITDPPTNWDEWGLVVRKTIEHYSGKGDRNISNVYYEVWNEPDLFGNWKISQEPNYLNLYGAAAKGAAAAENTNTFKFGGPASTALYRNWVVGLIDYTVKNKLRLDFISWHRYDLQPDKYLADLNQVDSWLSQSGRPMLKVISEWGADSDNSAWHDNKIGAAHMVSTVRQLLGRADLMFTFELKDGADPNKIKYWGRWGLLTYGSKTASIAAEKKPRYYALGMLNELKGERLKLEGEGTWVSAIAGAQGENINVLLVNFDPENRHLEVVPVTINGIPAGRYLYQEKYLNGIRNKNEEQVTDTLVKNVALEANDVVLLSLTKLPTLPGR